MTAFAARMHPIDRAPQTLLATLYERQLQASGKDPYLLQHADPRFINGQVSVFRWYSQFLPSNGAVLDWGCRHAPDSCLFRSEFGLRFSLHGCDFPEQGQFSAFHDYAALKYQQLTDVVRLPYENGSFDVVIGSGVLEHTAMDYESLKELYRVLKVNGRLVITYLPNRLSFGEWRLRHLQRHDFHRRLYSLSRIRQLLLRSGFYPVQGGYQTRLDQLSKVKPPSMLLQLLGKPFRLHAISASCLCIIAAKVDCM